MDRSHMSETTLLLNLNGNNDKGTFDDECYARAVKQKAQLELQLGDGNLNDGLNSNITIDDVDKVLHRAKNNKAVGLIICPMK